MDTKRLIIGTIVGGIVLHIVGYLIFDVAAADFYAANEGPASGAFRDVPMQGSMFVANLAYAALITLGLLSRGTVPSIGAGALIAAVIGLLVWLQADVFLYSYTTIRPLLIVIVDPLLEFVHAGVSGAIISAVLARVPKSAMA
jgi:hypothetical protein